MNGTTAMSWASGRNVVVLLVTAALLGVTILSMTPVAVAVGFLAGLSVLTLGYVARAYSLRVVALGTFLILLYAGSRDFAYLSVTIGGEHIFIAEIVLFILWIWLIPDLIRGWRGRGMALPPALAVYLLIGSVALLRWVSAYGLSAMRDSALCYYALTYPLTVFIASNEARVKALLWFCWVGWLCAGAVVVSRFLVGTGVPLDFDLFRYGAGAHALASISCVGWVIASCSPGTSKRLRCALGLVGAGQLWVGIFLIQHRSLFLATVGTCLVVGYCCLDKRWMTVLGSLSAVFAFLLVLAFAPWEALNLPPMVADTLARIGSIVGHQDANAGWRIEIWRRAVNYAMEHPVLGAGFGPPMGDTLAFGESDRVDPHNSYVAILYRMGIPGLLAFGIFWLQVVLRAITRRRRQSGQRVTLGMALGAHMGVAIFAAFNVVLEGPYMGIPFWISLALLDRVSTGEEGGEGIEGRPLVTGPEGLVVEGGGTG